MELHRSLWAAFWAAFLQDDSGQDLIEYALVAALLGLGAVASFRGLTANISTLFLKIGTTFTSAL